MTDHERLTLTERIFQEELEGAALISNNSTWRALPVIRNKRWFVENVVLIGDALQSAHPSIGSGTRIAMEDAIALATAIAGYAPNVADALEAFEAARRPGRQKLLDATDKSIDWYETIGDRLDSLQPLPLVFDFLMRTGRITDARLRAEFPRFMERYASVDGLTGRT
jgi:2-polyprenyl-6-methoxyphenol hydroxylase-like FAD-dependent oxidoreductase